MCERGVRKSLKHENSTLHCRTLTHSPGWGWGDFHEKGTGMLNVSLMGVNNAFWSQY